MFGVLGASLAVPPASHDPDAIGSRGQSAQTLLMPQLDTAADPLLATPLHEIEPRLHARALMSPQGW